MAFKGKLAQRMIAVGFVALGCVGCAAQGGAGGGADVPAEKVAPHTHAEVAFEELVPGVWLHLSVQRIEPWGDVPSYGLIVERKEGALLIDSAWTDAQTEEILTWSEAELGLPITEAVFTHAHEDKMGGVGALRERGVKTYAAADSNALAVQRGMVPAEHAISFNEEGDFALGEVVVFDPGPGHTIDNIVVGLPVVGVIFGGCLIRPAGTTDAGNTADADLAHWDEAVAAVGARFERASVVVPSHGEPGGRELLGHTVKLVREARGDE